MDTNELFHAGRLQETIELQTAQVRANPTDQAARFFLFELFLFTGELDRARKQLDVLRYDDPRHVAAVQQYRFALDAETHRRAVFAGTEQPSALTNAPEHVRLRLEALPYLARGEYDTARQKLHEANNLIPAIRGTWNETAFEGLYDADERFATVLEVFGTGGLYAWVPLEQVESIDLNPVSHPRDVVLRPAHLVIRDGPRGDVLLPGLYPGTHTAVDEAIKLGRSTDWQEKAEVVVCGLGGKMFIVNSTLNSLVNWQTLEIQHPA